MCVTSRSRPTDSMRMADPPVALKRGGPLRISTQSISQMRSYMPTRFGRTLVPWTLDREGRVTFCPGIASRIVIHVEVFSQVFVRKPAGLRRRGGELTAV